MKSGLNCICGCLFLLLFATFVTAGAENNTKDNADNAPNWAIQVPQAPTLEQSSKFGFRPLDYQTTFEELNLGSCAPVNLQTAIGVPGTVPLPFGYMMRSRYSEFDMVFQIADGDVLKRPYVLENFLQESPEGWYPGCVSRWDYEGVSYQVSVIMVPNEPQPVDLYEIVLKNTTDKPAQGKLAVTLDGAPSMKAEGTLIEDRTKPLLFMEPAMRVERIVREAGCVDPRTTACAPWDFAMSSDRWTRHRDGYYGMPIEYLLKADQQERLQVFLGFGGVPNITTPNWDEPLEAMDPVIRELMMPKPREVISNVEGDNTAQTVKLERRKHIVQRFEGQDIDGDGFIKVSVRASPQSRQPACLSWIYAYTMDAKVTTEDLFDDPGDFKGITGQFLPGPGQPGLQARALGETTEGVKPRYKIDVGGDFFDSPDAHRVRVGSDPAVFALRLHYDDTLAPGQENRYLLKLPAIDRPEPACYGNPCHPYDTKESWKPFLEARHPENTAPYGEDVPVGIKPSDYATFGPKPRRAWEKQTKAAQAMNWETGMQNCSRFWEDFIGKTTVYLTPETVLNDLYKHQLAILSLYVVQLYPSDTYMQVGGPFFYWDTSAARDIPYVMQALDLGGCHDTVEKFVRMWNTPRSKLPRSGWTLGQWDDEDPARNGLWLTRTRQHDGQGQMLWAMTDHYLYTGDKKWLAKNYAAMAKGAEWIIRARQRERERIGDAGNPAYGLMPLGSGEAGGGGHSFYVNSFGVMGMRKVSQAAAVLGKTADAKRFEKEADDFQQAVQRAIQMSFVRTGDFSGTIAQNLEQGLSQKQGEFTTVFAPVLVWPTEVMAAHDPLANACWQYMAWRGSTRGAIMEWPYIYCDWGVSMIRRGEPDRGADLFYTYVDNAYGTHDWAECMALNFTFGEFNPPKTGLLGGGESPHNWAAAFYVVYLRNLMLHEEGDTLHIAPASPRKWLAQPMGWGVENAPSYFGKVSYHLQADTDRTTIRGDVKLDPKRKPAKLLIHVRGPGGKGIKSVKLNGKEWDAFYGDTIVISKPDNTIDMEVKYENE